MPPKDSFVLPYLHKYRNGLLCCISPYASSYLVSCTRTGSPRVLSSSLRCRYAFLVISVTDTFPFSSLANLDTFSVHTDFKVVPPAGVVMFNPVEPSPRVRLGQTFGQVNICRRFGTARKQRNNLREAIGRELVCGAAIIRSGSSQCSNAAPCWRNLTPGVFVPPPVTANRVELDADVLAPFDEGCTLQSLHSIVRLTTEP